MQSSPCYEKQHNSFKNIKLQKRYVLPPDAFISRYRLGPQEGTANVSRILPPFNLQSKENKIHYSHPCRINKGGARLPRFRRKFQYTGVKDHVLATELLEPNGGMNTKVTKQGSDPRSSIQPVFNAKCKIRRNRFTRGSVDGIQGLHNHVSYVKNDLFQIDKPYQQEFTRVELGSENGLPLNHTRSGLCAYCPGWNFYELKNSNYAKHLGHSHGIYPDNTLAPDPLDMGLHYLNHNIISSIAHHSSKTAYLAVRCPVCSYLIQIRPALPGQLLNLKPYLRHFKDKHRVTKHTKEFVFLETDPAHRIK